MNYSSKKNGYVLLDAIIGLGLLSAVMITSLYVFSAGIMAAEDIKNRTVASELGKSKLDQLITQIDVKTETAGDFSPDFPGYTWTLEKTYVSQTNLYSLYNLKFKTCWQERGQQKEFMLETNILLKGKRETK